MHHLGTIPAPGLADEVAAVLDRRLSRTSPRPLAVALSGGGDSLALLLATSLWAKTVGRRLLVLTVDHGLRPESQGWTANCAATAQRLGLAFQALIWTGDKPATGLPAAARAARHALLAEAAREAGARVILMGHTADDGLEARVMRAAGSSTSEPREWAPSPAWPQGRDVFLLRPMLGVRRADIRAWLRARSEGWIDDPANEDTAYARPRARRALASGAPPPQRSVPASARELASGCRMDTSGGFEIARAALRDAPADALARFVAAACLCAAGGDRPPRREKVDRLSARLIGDAPVTASLTGARIEADAAQVRFLREAGEARRGGLASLQLQPGRAAVWDGRFEVMASDAVEVHARPGAPLPVAAQYDGRIGTFSARALGLDRLLAACGAIEQEPHD